MEIEKEDEEQFISAEALMKTTDSTQWDTLFNQGIGSRADSVTRWDRESLFMKFDPLVHSEEKGSLQLEPNVSHNYRLDLPRKDEPLVEEQESSEEFEMPDDGRELSGMVSRGDCTFAVPTKSFKLIPIETPPNFRNKALTISSPLSPIRCDTEILEIPSFSTSSPEMTNCSQLNVPNDKEAVIEAALSAQHEQFLLQLAVRNEKIQELIDAKTKEESITAEENEKTNQLIVEYEKTMTKYVEQIKDLKPKVDASQVEKLAALKDRDQALEDLKHVENSFSRLHQKYERVKGTLKNFAKNETILKNRDQELIMKLESRKKKIESMKEQATTQLTTLCQDYETKYSNIQNENLKLRAILRKNEMTLQTLEKNLEEKQKENTELNKICEELIGGGLKDVK